MQGVVQEKIRRPPEVGTRESLRKEVTFVLDLEVWATISLKVPSTLIANQDLVHSCLRAFVYSQQTFFEFKKATWREQYILIPTNDFWDFCACREEEFGWGADGRGNSEYWVSAVRWRRLEGLLEEGGNEQKAGRNLPLVPESLFREGQFHWNQNEMHPRHWLGSEDWKTKDQRVCIEEIFSNAFHLQYWLISHASLNFFLWSL